MEKRELTQKLREKLLGMSLIVVVKQKGVTVKEATNLRKRMIENDAELQVVKNTLSRLAIKGTPLEEISSFLGGPTALAYSVDPVAAARVIHEFTENVLEKVEIVGGWLNGKILDSCGIKTLAKLPSLNGLRGILLNLIKEPSSRIARLISEPAVSLVRVIKSGKCP